MTPPLKIFGDTIRELRKQKGLSQEDLADMCDLHRTYIGGVERGERNIGLLNILLLAKTLEVTPSSLFKDFTVNTKEEN